MNRPKIAVPRSVVPPRDRKGTIHVVQILREGRWEALGEDGASVFSRLGKSIRAELRKDLEDGVPNADLEHALARVAEVSKRHVYDKTFRKLLARHAEGQATLRKFRTLAREMHAAVSEVTGRSNGAASEMRRLLDAAEQHFAVWAEPRIPFPLVEAPGAPLLRLPAMKLGMRRSANRPRDGWKPAARATLRRIGVRAKVAALVVAHLGRHEKSATI